MLHRSFNLSAKDEEGSEEEEERKRGLIFSDNLFASDPTLPFGALALPAFDGVGGYVDVRNNHFSCDCDRLAWFVGAVVHRFDRAAMRDGDGGDGTVLFLEALYRDSGSCLACDGAGKCRPDERSFRDFARSALTSSSPSVLQCASSGLVLLSQQELHEATAAAEAAEEKKEEETKKKKNGRRVRLSSYGYEKDGGSSTGSRPANQVRRNEEENARKLKMREAQSRSQGKRGGGDGDGGGENGASSSAKVFHGLVTCLVLVGLTR